MLPRLPCLLASTLMLTLAACTTPAPQTSAVAQSSPTLGVIKLEKGMTADEIRSLLGKPNQTTLMPTKEGMAQLWTYERRLLRSNRVAASTIAVPVYKGPGMGDSNNIGTIDVPVDSDEHVVLLQTIKLMLLDGKLVEWKVSAKEESRTYD